ncbi:Guanine deaminase [bioreactor metagenome]|uniref:Guanine deaminase n=1 Tax=bioreactor metagenome TaxID=1076179 RepID=A0A644ZVT0_9ZZZZ
MSINLMREAIKEAETNLLTDEGGPFGAIVVKNGAIIGKGRNMVLKNNDPTCHAEVEAIREACRKLGTYDLTGCELYASSMCLGAIIWANIKKVYYANSAEDAGAIGFRDDYIYDFIEGKCKDKQVLELDQLGREEAMETFKRYQSANKTIY